VRIRYAGLIQRERLEAEGVRLDAAGRLDLAALRWTPPAPRRSVRQRRPAGS
jgi:hypothetical protein